MIKYVIKRILILIPILLAVSFVVFAILSFIPSDAARIMLGATAPQEAVDSLRESLGLNDPFLVRYGNYMLGALHGDFGNSYRSGQPVFQEILVRFPVTLKLAFFSILLVTVTGILLGVVSAIKQRTFVDYLLTVLSMLASAVPSFWLALMMMLVFANYMGFLPTYGIESWKSYIMPVIALSMPGIAELTRMTRSAMLETIGQDYIRTARAKGLSEGRVMFHHALKNALMPIITVIGSNFGSLLGGSVIIETVFSLPGLGNLIVTSIRSKDDPMVMAGTLFIALIFCLVLLAVDVAYALVDPRLRTRYVGRPRVPKKEVASHDA